MRIAALVLACLLAFSLAGCSGSKDKDPKQTADDCTEEESFNRFESRCVTDFEACYAWLKGKADDDTRVVTCQADSDGHAWVDWGFGLTGTIHVTVRDGDDAVVYENNVGNGQDRAKVDGAAGVWRMTVDFGTASGTGEIYLWG